MYCKIAIQKFHSTSALYSQTPLTIATRLSLWHIFDKFCFYFILQRRSRKCTRKINFIPLPELKNTLHCSSISTALLSPMFLCDSVSIVFCAHYSSVQSTLSVRRKPSGPATTVRLDLDSTVCFREVTIKWLKSVAQGRTPVFRDRSVR